MSPQEYEGYSSLWNQFTASSTPPSVNASSVVCYTGPTTPLSSDCTAALVQMLSSPSRLLLVNALGDMNTSVINVAISGGLPRQVESTLTPVKEQRNLRDYGPARRILAAEVVAAAQKIVDMGFSSATGCVGGV
jgi:hypothetical protein